MCSLFEQSIRTNKISSWTYVESYVESAVEVKCKRRLEYVKVVPFSRCSTGLQALFRDDQVAIQPTMITLPSVFCSLGSLSFLSSSSLFGLKCPFQNIIFSFLSQEMLTNTSVPPLHLFALKIEPPHTLCSHAIFMQSAKNSHTLVSGRSAEVSR